MNEKEIIEAVRLAVEKFSGGVEKMTLALAETLAAETMKIAENAGVKAVVCVSDEAGNPKTVKCMDDSYIASYGIAVNKAYTSVALKMPTSELKKLAQPGQPLYGIQFTGEGRIIIFGGGEPLYSKSGRIIGGLGVSGGSEEQDTGIANDGAKFFEKIT